MTIKQTANEYDNRNEDKTLLVNVAGEIFHNECFLDDSLYEDIIIISGFMALMK